MPNNDAPIPTQTRAALRAIEARRIARIDPTDLTDLALARYASHWAGTARGETAETEIDRRSAVAFSSAVAKIIAAGVTVRESIRHGNYRHDGNATAPTLARAVAVLLANSPYGNHLDEPAAQITLDLAANGHANHGWADYDVVA